MKKNESHVRRGGIRWDAGALPVGLLPAGLVPSLDRASRVGFIRSFPRGAIGAIGLTYQDRAEARDKMTTLCSILHDRTPEIVSRWEEYVGRPPWSQLSEADRLDELPLFLDALFNCTICASPADRQPERFLHAAT